MSDIQEQLLYNVLYLRKIFDEYLLNLISKMTNFFFVEKIPLIIQ